MQKKNNWKITLTVLQIIIFVALIFCSSYMSYAVNKLNGTSKVINYAGIVRGGTQLLVKEELFGNEDKALQEKIDTIMKGLKDGGTKFDLTKIDDSNYQIKLVSLNQTWEQLKAAIESNRKTDNNTERVYTLSQRHFVIADEVVMLAEGYSEKYVDIIDGLDIAMWILFVLLMVFFVGKGVYNIMSKRINDKGFSLVELIVAMAIMAIVISILAPTLIGNIEKSRHSKDLYNAKAIVDVMQIAYVDGSIKFQETAGKSAVWAFVTREKAQFFANGASKFPKINGVSNANAQTEFRNLLKDYGVDSDSVTVNVTTVKDTGTVGTDEGWNWYCIYILSNGTIGVASGPGNAPENYISSWGTFESRILNWEGKENSALAREIAY